MPISEQTYRRVALEDDDDTWELLDGWLRAKPTGSATHNSAVTELAFVLMNQTDRAHDRVRINGGRLRCSPRDYYVPDVFVVPTALGAALRGRPDALEVYDDSVGLVAEVWEPPTDDYDATAKLAGYQRRGDLEIWWLDPYDRVVRAWQRRRNGSYAETTHTSGIVKPAAHPGVTINLDAFFRDL